ncbi:MAG: 2-hydroxyacid dehydrogenase [Proteobacteria bacterium]|nr:2-hydroxyacid dehydrogenase [Pseudomonadota bacterium]
MEVAVFSSRPYEQPFLIEANKAHNHKLTFFETSLNDQTALLTTDFSAVSCFVSDHLTTSVIKTIAERGVRLIALRSAGFNNVDLTTAKNLGLTVVRVPAYSPYAVAEFAVGLILTLNRKIHRAYNLVKEHNFLLTNLLGFDLHGKTVGVVGTGKIGSVFAQIMQGFGCKLLAFDPYPNATCLNLGVKYVDLKQLCRQSDIISLHCPLNRSSEHIINAKSIADMKPGVMLINTGRGGLVDTKAVIQALKNKTIGYLGMDVYEEEEDLFFQDLSDSIIQDDVFARLQTFPNVIITGHQAFFTKEALTNIAATTMENITGFERGDANIFVI